MHRRQPDAEPGGQDRLFAALADGDRRASINPFVNLNPDALDRMATQQEPQAIGETQCGSVES